MRLTLKQRKNVLGFMFIAPWILGFTVFALYPIAYSLYLSFNQVAVTAEGIRTEFIGFGNFQRAFVVDRVMVLSLIAFLRESILMMLIINVFALIFALILNAKIKGQSFFRVLFFLPVVVVSGPVLNELQNNGLLVLPGIESFGMVQLLVQSFGDRAGELIVSVFNNLVYMFWFSGVQIIVFLAVLQKMNRDLYEAASIDGASPWESFWKLTLPMLKPVFLINLIYTFIMLATFSENPVINIIRSRMFSSDVVEGFGYASALAWIYFVALVSVVILLIILFSIRREKKIGIKFTEFYPFNMTRYQTKETFLNTNLTAVSVKKRLVGSQGTNGLLMRSVMYLLIITVTFTFVYPFIHLVLKSFQSQADLIDLTVGLIPSGLYLGNYQRSFQTIGFWRALRESFTIATLPSLAQMTASAMIGYGLSRFEFSFKKLVMVLILFTFIIPPQILMIPTFLLYRDFGLLDSVLVFVIPAALGQGIRSAIFIMIFYQFFNMIPRELDEAAEIDGASPFKIFYRIALPLAAPAILVVFLFSFVWYWNETFLTSLYIRNARTLPIQLSRFASSFRENFPVTGGPESGFVDTLNEAVYMAGILVSILPLLLVYFVLQRWFVEGVDRSGITGQ